MALKTIIVTLLPVILALALSGCTQSESRSLASDSESLASKASCAFTTRSIPSAANTEGKTQSCTASLPVSKPSSIPVSASVTNSGNYSLVCKSSGQWEVTPSASYCPPPALVVAPITPPPPAEKSRGVRLDPAYFYSSHAGQSPSQIATDVISSLKNARTNTIYLYAYNAIYGAYYPTTYAQTLVEPGYGLQNIFGALLSEAHSQGLKVVAVVPLNNFKSVWQNNSAWRVKQAGGVDYVPYSDTYLLSASSTEYKNWYTGFINDLIARNPSVDQVEAVEPTLDYFWSGIPDQNPAALSAFSAQYPGAAVGSASWLNFRAQEFLNLVALFNQIVHANNKESGLVHTWTVKSDGSLMDARVIRDSSGFDFVGVATLTGTSKTDHMVSEFIWQQWFSEYASILFNPDWITQVAATYTNTLRAAGSSSDLIVHVEISTFTGAKNTTTPTNSEFGQTLANTATLTNGVSVYDYNQIRTRSAFSELSKW